MTAFPGRNIRARCIERNRVRARPNLTGIHPGQGLAAIFNKTQLKNIKT
jgi:hypothetical protein